MNFLKKMVPGLVACLALALPAGALAHVTVSPEEAPAKGYSMLTFTVPHGCDGAATNRVQVKMPAQVISATPGVVAGWKIKTVEGKLPQPGEMHGEAVTEGIREVTWTGGPLPDAQLQQFRLSVAFAGKSGEQAEFKVVQGCVNGEETAWIQTAPASGEEPDHPAPTVALADSGEHEAAGAEASEPVSASNGDSGEGLAIVALILGGLGLLAGSTALIVGRRK